MKQPYIPKPLRERVARQACYRCGYCLTAEVISGIPLQIDHIVPFTLGSLTEEDNLWMACSQCNDRKNDRIAALDPLTQKIVALFDPRHQSWDEHFAWIDSGVRIVGKTATGRATAEALGLNRDLILETRRIWISAGLHPPED